MANTIKIKRRAAGGAAGAPASLANGELAFNEQDLSLWYGLPGGPVAIGGSGAFQPLDADLTSIAAAATNAAFYYRVGSGNWQPVVIGTGLSFSSGTLSSTAAVSGAARGFTAYSAANQTINSATWTKLVLGTTSYNNGSYYDTAQSRYTPPAGETGFTISVLCETLVLGSNAYVALYKNGTLLRFAANNTTDGSVLGSFFDQANGTDYYEAWVFATSTGSTFLVNTGNNDVTFFQAFQPVGTPGAQGPPGANGAPGAPGQVQASGTPTAGQGVEWVDAVTIKGVPSPWTTGDIKATMKGVADAGWVMMNDGTIGDASSGGTTRANADCQSLFTLLWSSCPDSILPVTPGGRGASASADWTAHKKIAIPKALGRALAGAGAGAGLTNRALGATVGEEAHTQATAELASHGHTVSDPTHGHSYSDPSHRHNFPTNYNYNIQAGYITIDPGSSYNVSLWGAYVGVNGDITAYSGVSISISAAATSIGVQAAGSSTPFNVMQPSMFVNFMMKL